MSTHAASTIAKVSYSIVKRMQSAPVVLLPISMYVSSLLWDDVKPRNANKFIYRQVFVQ